MHRLLARQIKRFFGEGYVFDEKTQQFLNAINTYYGDNEKENKLLENALDMSTTELRDANDKIKKANSDLTNAVLNTLSDCVVAMDLDGNVLFTNPATCKLSGYTSEELLGKNFHELLHYQKPDGTHFPKEECAIVMSLNHDDIESKGNSYIIKKNGSVADIKYVGTAIYQNGSRFGYVISFQDLTEQKQKDELLMLQKNALDATANMIVITDNSGFVEYANKSFYTFSGFEEYEVAGRHTKIFSSGLNTREFYNDMWKVIQEGRTWEGILYNKKKDGSVYPEEMTITPIIDSQEITHFVAVKKDITDRLANEEALKDAMTKALEASKMKSEFLSTMSHEIRTPMNGIIGMVEILLQTELEPEQKEYATIVKHSSESLLAILNDILDFSKMEAGKLDIINSDFDLPETCSGISKLLGSQAKEKGLEFVINIDKSIPVNVIGDSVRIRQVMMNLIGNAIKFTERGSVKVSLAPVLPIDGGFIVRFSVADTGVGIPKTSQRKLFNSFTQADSSTSRKFGGTGLGLAICKKLVALMDGDIGVISEEGRGSTFWFEIPLKTSNINILDRQNDTDIINKYYLENISNKRILLAEDNVVNQKIALIQLQRLGFEVDIAPNGQEAVDKALRHKYELILMDCQMPTKDGYTATKELRSAGYVQPILAMTANAMQGDREKCIQCGMNDYITKPINSKELQEMLSKWLDATPAGDGSNDNFNTSNAYLDMERLEEFFGDDMEMTKEFLDIYIESTTNIIEEIIKELSVENFSKLKSLGHNLKGSSANAGVQALSDIGFGIETAAKEEKLETIGSQIENLRLIFEKVKAEIANLF